jgi:hypothetical protein
MVQLVARTIWGMRRLVVPGELHEVPAAEWARRVIKLEDQGQLMKREEIWFWVRAREQTAQVCGWEGMTPEELRRALRARLIYREVRVWDEPIVRASEATWRDIEEPRVDGIPGGTEEEEDGSEDTEEEEEEEASREPVWQSELETRPLMEEIDEELSGLEHMMRRRAMAKAETEDRINRLRAGEREHEELERQLQTLEDIKTKMRRGRRAIVRIQRRTRREALGIEPTGMDERYTLCKLCMWKEEHWVMVPPGDTLALGLAAESTWACREFGIPTEMVSEPTERWRRRVIKVTDMGPVEGAIEIGLRARLG